MFPKWIESHTENGNPRQRLSTVTAVDWLRIESEDAVRTIVIDRPESKNAIPTDGWPHLTEAFADFEHSDDRVLIVTGASGDFCAGAELDMDRFGGGLSVAEAHERMKIVGGAATVLHRISKPTIAAVDGYAVGGGMNLAIGCDVVIVSDRARFSEIFVKRGLSLDLAGTWLLPRLVGLQRAKEIALSGRFVEAEEAVRVGLAMELVQPENLMTRAHELARSFLEGAPVAQMFAKQALNASFESAFGDSVSWEGQSQSILFGTEDVVEGVGAFLQKRKPEWKGR